MRTIPFLRVFSAALLISTAFVFWGCNTPPTAGRDVMEVDPEEELSPSYPIPPISELTEKLSAAGVGYVIDVGNDPERSPLYVTSTSRAMALGVYGADLSYASTYGIKSDVLRYLNVVMDLSRSMNIRPSLLETLVSKGEEALNDKDSVQQVSSQSIFEVYAALCSSGQHEEAVLFLAGGWLEAVYIGSYIASLSQSNEQVLDLVLKQRSTYSTILSLLQRHKKTSEGERVATLFEGLESSYSALQDSQADDKTLLQVTEAFEQVRNQIVETVTK